MNPEKTPTPRNSTEHELEVISMDDKAAAKCRCGKWATVLDGSHMNADEKFQALKSSYWDHLLADLQAKIGSLNLAITSAIEVVEHTMALFPQQKPNSDKKETGTQ